MLKPIGINIKFEPRDLWVGAFWNVDDTQYFSGTLNQYWHERIFILYICILPTLPIILMFDITDREIRKSIPLGLSWKSRLK